MSKSNEIWRVEINGQSLETDLAALKVMICQGEISPLNRVSKGNLSPIEAGRVPVLRRVFAGEETLESIISEATATTNEPPAAPRSVFNPEPVEQTHISRAPETVGFHHATAATQPLSHETVSAIQAPVAQSVSMAVETAQPIASEPLTVWTRTAANQPDSQGYDGASHKIHNPETTHQAVVRHTLNTADLREQCENLWQQNIHNSYGGDKEEPAANAWQPPAEPEQQEPPPVETYWQDPAEAVRPVYQGAAPQPFDEACFNHPDTPPKFACRACGTLACAGCVKKIGTVSLCLQCGELCHEYTAVKRTAQRHAEMSSGFGLGDFAAALSYPFKNAVTLLGAAALYALLAMLGLKGQLLGFGFLCGFITRVIKQVSARGATAEGLFGNTDFSFYDDVIAPLGRGICVMAVTYGPMLALIIMLVMGILGGAGLAEQEARKERQEQEKIMAGVDELLKTEGDPAKQAEAMRQLDPLRAGQYSDGTNAAQNAPEAAKSEQEENFRLLWPMIMGIGGGIVALFLLSVLWAFFYYPMALTVAGFTENAGAVLNPLVGLDTMRHLGLDYLKVFGIYVFTLVVGGVVSFAAYTVLASLTMPIVGNLPARFVDSFVTFYFHMALAFAIGMMLYKGSDRLGLAAG